MSSLFLLLNTIKRSFMKPTLGQDVRCPVCSGRASYLDSVDLNKSCEEANGLKLPKANVLIRYYLCDQCRFCFAPEFGSWTFSDFERRIYNDEYELVDPEYRFMRPHNNAGILIERFGNSDISHLDYGGGSGLLSKTLSKHGWNSQSYDPFVNQDVDVEDLGQFDLLTAFEVFEHVPDVNALFADLKTLLKPDGLLFFSTLLSEEEISRGKPLTWWYAAPRNGHISLFSKESMRICMQKNNLQFASFSPAYHIAFQNLPTWASHLFAPGSA